MNIFEEVLVPVLIADSNNNCPFPGFSTLRFLTKMIHKATITAMIIHVTTTDSLISSNPFKNGIFMTVSHCSSSSNLSVKLPVSLTPFLYQIVIYDKVPFNKKKLLILGTKKNFFHRRTFALSHLSRLYLSKAIVNILPQNSFVNLLLLLFSLLLFIIFS